MYADFILHAGLIAGYLIYFSIIFAESGLFFGFFLPGDSLLFSLGLVAAAGHLNIWMLIIIGSIAAILGDNVGYTFGRKLGPSLFSRPNSKIFNQENIKKAQLFYDEHGKKTIILARFTPFIRTFAPIIAGAAKMDYSTFFFYNVIGGITWVTSISLLGYFLGSVIPNIEHYVLPIIALIVIFSVIPSLLHFKKSKTKRP